MMLRSQIVGCGGYLPERVVTNDELAARLDTSLPEAALRQAMTRRGRPKGVVHHSDREFFQCYGNRSWTQSESFSDRFSALRC